MPRKQVVLENAEKYHIYNRGVDKRVIFQDKSDYLRFYISLLHFNNVEPVMSLRDLDLETLPKNKLVEIEAYCLLPNHFHLLLEQLVDNGISEFMKRVSGGYTTYFNEKHGRTGVLFQGKFKRVHVDSDEYYNYLFDYVNENHYVHNICELQKIYTTSSLHYRGEKISKLITSQSVKYDAAAAQEIACEIHKTRESSKDLVVKNDS